MATIHANNRRRLVMNHPVHDYVCYLLLCSMEGKRLLNSSLASKGIIRAIRFPQRNEHSQNGHCKET